MYMLQKHAIAAFNGGHTLLQKLVIISCLGEPECMRIFSNPTLLPSEGKQACICFGNPYQKGSLAPNKVQTFNKLRNLYLAYSTLSPLQPPGPQKS